MENEHKHSIDTIESDRYKSACEFEETKVIVSGKEKMHSLSDYEVISSLPNSKNSFKVGDKVGGGFKALHIVEYNKDLGDFHTKSSLSRICDSHPHHIKYFEHFIKKDCSCVCYIMELADGAPLYHFIERCREENLQFEESYIWRVMSQLYSVIKVLSTGSLTLNNIFVDKQGDVKWNSLISADSPVPLTNQLGCLATEMCTAGESTYIPSFYTKELRTVISSLVLGEEVSLKSSSSKGYPKLYPRIPSKPLPDEFLESLIKSNPNIYESVIYSDTTRTIPISPQPKNTEDDLKFRIQSIKAQEALLRQKELNLIIKENELIEREKRILQCEKRLSDRKRNEELSIPKRPPKSKHFDSSENSNEFPRPPTVAKLKIPPLPPRIKSIQQQKKVSFKSPKKFIKYDIELKPSSSNIPLSLSSDDSDEITKRKSILSMLGLNAPKTNKTPETSESQGESKDFKIKVSGIAKWTSENKKAAFDMLAAMNAKGSVVATKGSSQRIYERSRSRRSSYGFKTSF